MRDQEPNVTGARCAVFIVHTHPEPKSFNGAMTHEVTDTLTAAGLDGVDVKEPPVLRAGCCRRANLGAIGGEADTSRTSLIRRS
jgi:hypothetical protein